MLKPCLLIACLLPWCSIGQTAAPSAVTGWIRGSAIPLASPVAGRGFDDMQPLKKVVGDSRIVALGEATHGSREFFQLKHRMLEFLATEMGFTIFSIEANMPEAYRLNDYVLTGKGDPAALIKGMYFWTWNTEEVLDMVRWMRAFNESGKGPVQFTGFDMQTPNVALGIVRDAVAKSDPEYVPTLETARKMALAPVKTPQSAFGTAAGTFPLAPVLGRKIKYSGYIKTDKVTDYAGLWWRADVGKKPGAFNNMAAQHITGTTDWTRYEFELDIPADTTNINFGVLMGGEGTAWFDDLKVEIDGAPYRGNEFDFSFEGPALKGLFSAIPAYPARLDREVYHSGQQSLRISHTAVPVNPNAVDPREAAAAWTKVVAHLDAAPKPDPWVVQNARVVLQCMQMHGNQVSRDASMAANIRWILEQNPKAKIVLWAHNGHVMTGTGYSMGSELRDMYGAQMTVFGFSFNQGGFQAVSSEGKGLHDFTVPPAPTGSFDATLASAKIPLFALDLRGAPKSGPVADWLRAAHSTRSIGALYPENDPYAFMSPMIAPERFDVILFVESPTPARKNGTMQAPSIPYKAGAPDDSGAIVHTDPDFAVSVKLPKGWGIAQAFRWGEQQTTLSFSAPENQPAGQLYFQMTPNLQPLLAAPAAKANQRTTEGLADYRIRPDSIQPRTIGGHPALAAIADFTGNGNPTVEYLVWVSGEKSNALFFARCPAADLAALQSRVDPVIASIKLP